MTEYKRVKCINCGEENPRKLHEEADRNNVLYYSMQGTPVHAKKMKCGSCGTTFDKA